MFVNSGEEIILKSNPYSRRLLTLNPAYGPEGTLNL